MPSCPMTEAVAYKGRQRTGSTCTPADGAAAAHGDSNGELAGAGEAAAVAAGDDCTYEVAGAGPALAVSAEVIVAAVELPGMHCQ